MLTRKLLARASTAISPRSPPIWPTDLSLSPVRLEWMGHRCTSSSKFSLKHPRSPHVAKAKMLYALRPLYARDERRVSERCQKPILKSSAETKPPHPVETILAREARRVMAANKIVVICHKNPTQMEDLKSYRNAIWKLNMRLWPQFNNRVLRFAMEGGKLANIIPILEVNTLMVTCSDLNFGNVIRGLKRIPTVVPLVVVVNGEYILSIRQLQEFAKKYRTGIVEAHSELVSVLSNPASSLMQALQHEAMTLSTCLDHLAKQQPATVDAELAVPAVE